MKIRYITNDLFGTEILHILHGCNAQGVMGSGIAKIIKEQYFDAFAFYATQYDEHGLKLGDVQFVPTNGKVIVNAVTQEFYGRDGKRYVSYDAVAAAMRTANRVLKLSGYTQLAMPKIGAGLGGGDWDTIAAIIEQEMVDVEPVVYVQ
jgi:O-acetyl-ADP-ribose deacetylase (regulator of RNase III)